MSDDVRLIRDDLAAFAAAAGLPLTEWQSRSLELETRTTVIVAPRQSGKSRSMGALSLHRAFRDAGVRVLLVSAGEEASRRLLGQIRSVAAASDLLRGSVVDERSGLLSLSNGSEIRSVPASERQIRGWAVDLLLVDEAALVPDALLLGAALPTTAARPEARIVLASSANAASGAFFDHAIRGDQGDRHVRTFRWALSDCAWITPSAIEAARASMSEMRFRAEYEGVFAGASDSLFSREMIERVSADYVPTPLERLQGPARVLAGVDWGQTTDRSALVAIARAPTPQRCFMVATAKRWPAGYLLHRVVDEIAGSPAHFAAVAMETNGLGGPCAQMLSAALAGRAPQDGGSNGARRSVLVDEAGLETLLAINASQARQPAASFQTRRVKVHTSAELKAAAYSALRLLIEQEQLLLPSSAEDLIRELLMLRVDLSPGGGERIEASSGHDDLADALMLATVPYRDRRGRWRTVIDGLADPRRALPELTAPAIEGQTVETGGGIEIQRRPPLQSVAGSLVTLPAGAKLKAKNEINPRLEAMRRIAAAGKE